MVSRQQNIITSLVTMADNLVDNFDVVDLLTGLTSRCVSVLDVSAAGVMFATPGNDLRLVASSSDAMKVVELFELQAREGPCLDAFQTGERVETEILKSGSGRWPRFSAVAIDAGFRSALALPLRLRERTVGALNLFKVEATPVDEQDIIVAQGLADLATISVLQHGTASEIQRVNEQLNRALESRIVIEQAKGVLAERAGIDLAEAFVRLRSYARKNNLLLADVAAAAIDGLLPPTAWAASKNP